jgi:hypothetical protein
MYMVWGRVFKFFASTSHWISHVVDRSFHCILLERKLMGTVSKGNVYKLWFMWFLSFLWCTCYLTLVFSASVLYCC